MPLSANTRLGPYEIVSMLGVGGMGEVYRARDSRLNRDVAIKILREDGTAGPEGRSRFEREARAVAALNHPNIIAVYDFGAAIGQQFIVSELIDGESLRSLLKGRPLPLRKLIDIATQVADGLAAAHAAGFVHRDLKPENVMLAKDGRIKILDFGLARQSKVSSDRGETAAYQDPSATFVSHGDGSQHLTQDGAILGTASYMSPEQALGHEIDYRSDQFSLGLIIYELVSGKQAFAKPSSVETMAAIVREEPPTLNEKLPPPLRWIIDRCLAKEPEQRYESTRDLYRDLRNLREHISEAYTSASFTPVAAQPKVRDWRVRVGVGIGCLILGSLAAWLLKPAGQNIARYRYTPFATDAHKAVWSPDGKAVAYSSNVNGIYQVFLRYLNSPVPIQLTHEAHSVESLGWSSDQSHLILKGFTDRTESPYDKLYSVATVGGELEFIMDFDCDACDLSRDGKVFATLRKGKDGNYNVEVSDPIGAPLKSYMPAPFATRELYNVPHLYFSPDGKSILLFRAGDNDKDEAWLLPYPAGKAPKRVLETLPAIQYTPSFSWMPDGRHIVVALAADENAPTHLWLADIESNRLTPLTTGTVNEVSPVVAPDGKSLIYSQQIENLDIVSLSIQDGTTRTLLSTSREESMAAWAGNQSKLTWVTNRSGPYEIWVRQQDGSERPVVTAADFSDGPNRGFMNPALAPDGNRLIFTRIDDAGVTRLWMSSLAGGSPVRLTSLTHDSEYGGVWSPDGSRFAYLQILAGKQSLMMVKTSGNAKPMLLKDLGQGYYLPDWSPTAEWITYRDDKGWNLISPDGKASKFLGKIDTDYLAFSKDGKVLYGIQTGDTEADQDRATLFSLDPVTLKQKTIRELGREFRPASTWIPGIRFSLSPDGKSFVYGTAKERMDLWTLQGFGQPGWRGQVLGQ